jgi:DNA-binding response OmpR family regulator
VKSAAELLARVRGDLDQIDLIVLDLRLPHAPGVDLVRAIRKLDEGRLPVLISAGRSRTRTKCASSRRSAWRGT